MTPPAGSGTVKRGGGDGREGAAMVAVALALALSSVAMASARACSATLAVLAARDGTPE